MLAFGLLDDVMKPFLRFAEWSLHTLLGL
jgi:hypothetical protein